MVHFVQNKVVWPGAKNIGMLFQDNMLGQQCRHLWVDGCSNLLKIMQDYFCKIFIVPLSLVMLHYEMPIMKYCQGFKFCIVFTSVFH